MKREAKYLLSLFLYREFSKYLFNCLRRRSCVIQNILTIYFINKKVPFGTFKFRKSF